MRVVTVGLKCMVCSGSGSIVIINFFEKLNILIYIGIIISTFLMI